MANDPKVTSVSSTPPQVSDRMRELVKRYHSAAYEVGRFGEDPNHPPRRSWSAVTAERSEASTALLREIAALEAKTTWQPIEMARKDRPILALMGGEVSLASWTVEALWVDASQGVTWSRDNQPTRWMPLPEAPHV